MRDARETCGNRSWGRSPACCGRIPRSANEAFGADVEPEVDDARKASISKSPVDPL